MRNLKKLLAVVVAVCVLATMSIPAFAETAAAAKTDAQICQDLNVLKGDGSAFADYLAKGTTRFQAALIQLRLLGKEAEALAETSTETFTDASTLTWAAGRPVLAYLKKNPDMGWSGDGVSFSPNAPATAQMIYKALLTGLGYKQGTDFEYADAVTFAAGKGLTKIASVATITNSDLGTALVEALKANLKDGTKTLAADLVAKNVITSDAAVAAGLYTVVPATLEVKSVSAVNLKEIVILFNKAVDKTSAENTGKYSAAIGAIKSASLAADGVTVTLKLDAGVVLSNQTETKVSVIGVKSASDAGTVTSKDIKFTPLDNALPTISSVVALGNSAVKVNYSEPIKTVAATMFKIDDKAFWGSYTLDGRTVTLKPYNASTVLASGSHKLTSSKLEDFSSLKSLEESVNFDVAADKAAPTVSSITATLESVKVVFSEDVDPNTVATGDIYFKSGTSKKNPKSVSISGAEVTADFSNNILPAYETSIFVEGISDYSGNAMTAAEVKVTATVDQTRPEITDVKINTGSKSITITFSKAVAGTDKSNYSIKDKDAKTVSIQSVTASSDNKKMTINLYAALPTGTNTLSINGVADTTTLHNVMLPYSVSLDDVKDGDAPDATTVYGSARQIIASFDEEMDLTTITNPANYLITFKGVQRAIPDGTEFTPTTSGKAVMINLPEKIDDIAVVVGAVNNVTKLQIMGVKDKAGNFITNYVYGPVVISTANAAVAANYDSDNAGTNALMTDGQTIKVRFNAPIGEAAVSDFTLGAGWGTTISGVDVDSSDLVVLHLAADIGTKVKDTLNIKAGNAMKTISGNAVTASAVSIKDKVAPKILTAASGTTYFDLTQAAAGGVTIVVPFTEALDPAGALEWAFDLNVYRANGNTTLVAGTDYQTAAIVGAGNEHKIQVTITPAAVKSSLYAINVKDGANYIKDTTGNKAASSDAYDTDELSDATAPTMVSATRVDATHISVKLSELCAAASLVTVAGTGGFIVSDTVTPATKYVVSATAAGATNDIIVLTVADITASATTGVTVTFAPGTVTDAVANPMAADATGVVVAPW